MKFILFALQLAYARAGQMCYDCSRMPSPSDCSHTILCNEHETCHTTQIVTDNGHIVYDSGCKSNARCPGTGSVKMSPLHDVIISPRIPGDIVTCIECCHRDYCNNEGCGAKPLLDRPSRGPICVTCDVSVSPDACEFVSVCTQDEECFLSSDYNPLTGDKRYTSKCGSKQTCEALRRNYAVVMGRRAAPDCLGCCDDDYCNNNCSNVLMVGTGDSHTSSQPTTETTPPSTTPAPQTPESACESSGGYKYLNEWGYCVRIHTDEQLNWDAARARCKQVSGDLIVFHNKNEEALFDTWLKDIHAQSPVDIRYWVGATDRGHEGQWFWVDGTPVASGTDVWWPGEPNDAGYPDGLHENCAAANFHRIDGFVKLNDLNCTINSYFICEKNVI